MSAEPALLAAVVARPADDAPRLAYADWLEESGAAEAAARVRALAASASYIAAPPAARMNLPTANPTYYLTAWLAITFPFKGPISLRWWQSLFELPSVAIGGKDKGEAEHATAPVDAHSLLP